MKMDERKKMNNNYSKAYTEVLEIIKYFPEEEYSRIPKEKIDFYKKNMDKNYNFKINPEIDLSNQDISAEANAIIINLFTDYFATENQKLKIKEILDSNQKKSDQLKREKYNPDNIFENKQPKLTEIPLKEDNNNTSLVEYKESFFTKFKKFIFRLLHI